MPLTRGSLYRYHYLWSHQRWRGEESGRKARPVCLVMRSSSNPTTLFLFPITTKKPPEHIAALEIDRTQCRFSGLTHPSWIVLKEYNRVDGDELYDFESLEPIGQFTDSFLAQIAEGIKRVSESERLTGVKRS